MQKTLNQLNDEKWLLKEIIKKIENKQKPPMLKSKYAFAHKHYNYGLEDSITILNQYLKEYERITITTK